MQQRLFGSLFLLLWLVPATELLAFEDIAADRDAFFETQIRPLLAEQCFSCHSGAKAAAGLRLDVPDGFRTDDGQGMVIVPGVPATSRLIHAVEHRASSSPMPPNGKLSSTQVEDLKRWIAWGGTWPEGSSLSSDPASSASDHWSFAPLRRVPAPQSPNAGWNRCFIDRWIDAQRVSNGLTPSPRATPNEWARRLAADITGLPPEDSVLERLNEQDNFEALEQIVDELLESTAFGEHWGRHWLDIARYSEFLGMDVQSDSQDRNPFAYAYRDWVIEAFNRDLPYNEFVELQLSADQMRSENDPDLAALGFLTVGNKFEGDEPTIIDDRLDVIFRGTQGLTISCARCHDHKYDPIPTQDYYALYGVFSEGQETETPILRSEADREVLNAYQKKLRDATYAFEHHKRKLRVERFQTPHTQMAKYLLAAAEESDPASDEHGWRADGLHQSVVSKIRRTLIETRTSHHSVFAPWHLLNHVSDDEFGPLANSLAKAYQSHLRSQDQDENSEESTSHEGANDDDGEEDIHADGVTSSAQDDESTPNVEPINARMARDWVANTPRNRNELAEWYGRVLEEVATKWLQLIDDSEANNLDLPVSLPDEAEDEIRQQLFAEYPSLDISDEDLMNLLEDQAREEFDRLRESVAEIRNDPEAPAHARIFVDGNPDREQYIFIRGKQDRPGNRVLPKFLSILSPDDAPFSNLQMRRELARCIVDPHNPLTARVWVNRVWDRLIGRGIVDTPSDFGTRGAAPSHPELLDALALDFIKNGWSTKTLIRKIVLSETYLQSSRDREDAIQIDPENRSLWRMNRKRLSKESLRDSVLSIAEQLDLSTGGVSLPAVELDQLPRRTVYFSVHRRQLDPMSLAFDMPSPSVHSPRRHTTTLPQQALYMLNNPLIIQASRNIAEQVWQDQSMEENIRDMVWKILRREPEAEEMEVFNNFIVSHTIESTDEKIDEDIGEEIEEEAEEEMEEEVEGEDSQEPSDQQHDESPLSPFAKLAHILLMSNEFIFID